MKNVFKKALCLLTASLMLILCACNNSADGEDSSKSNQSSASKNQNSSNTQNNTSTNNPELDAQFLSVLNSEAPFISEDSKSVLLKDYSYGNNGATEVYYAVPQEYAVVDLDGDGTNEVVADITSSQTHYMVFHKYNNSIYGFLIGRRSLQGLKKDGSFLSSGGAGLQVYSKMEFNKNTYKVIDEAYWDNYKGIYKIDGKEVTKEAIDKYKTSWDLKENAHFIRFSKYYI